MAKQKEFTIFVGQLGLGECSEEEKEEFLKWINNELKNRKCGEELRPVTNRETEIKYFDWDALSKIADVVAVIGFSYWLLPSHIKGRLTVDYFIKKAKEWVRKHKTRFKDSQNLGRS